MTAHSLAFCSVKLWLQTHLLSVVLNSDCKLTCSLLFGSGLKKQKSMKGTRTTERGNRHIVHNLDTYWKMYLGTLPTHK